MENQEFVSLRTAVAQVLRIGGLSILDDPKRFSSFLLDVADQSRPEVNLLAQQLDVPLLAPVRLAAQKPNEASLRTAQAKVRDILESERYVKESLAQSTSVALVGGLADFLGVAWMPVGQTYSSTPPAPAPAPAPSSTRAVVSTSVSMLGGASGPRQTPSTTSTSARASNPAFQPKPTSVQAVPAQSTAAPATPAQPAMPAKNNGRQTTAIIVILVIIVLAIIIAVSASQNGGSFELFSYKPIYTSTTKEETKEVERIGAKSSSKINETTLRLVQPMA